MRAASVIAGREDRPAFVRELRLAYVPGEANLWPGLTGSQTLHLLGRVQGKTDPAYRDELIERFRRDLAAA